MKNYWTPEGWALIILVSIIPFVFILIVIVEVFFGLLLGKSIPIYMGLFDLIESMVMVITGGVLGYLKAKHNLQE